jgi:hypothetical protein
MTVHRKGFIPPRQPTPAAVAGRVARMLAMLGAAGLANAALAPVAHAMTGNTVTANANAQRGQTELERVQSASDFSVEDRTGVPGVPLALGIKLPDNPAQAYSFLMFRNLPQNFKLSAGFGAKDYWAVSLSDAENLRLIPPDDFQGIFSMDVLLIKGKGIEPERRTANIAFADIDTPAVTASIEAAPAPSPPDSDRLEIEAPPPAVLPRERVVARSEPAPVARAMTDADRLLMERGNNLATQGDIASARLMYLQVARKGIAAGALAMGRSFDPEFLHNLNVRGLQPDIAQARSWYKTAADLGSDQANRYLSALSTR